MKTTFTIDTMAYMKALRIKNRDFLRNFKLYKMKLQTKECNKIIIEENGHQFEFLFKRKPKKDEGWHEMIEYFRKNKGKYTFERTFLKTRLR